MTLLARYTATLMAAAALYAAPALAMTEPPTEPDTTTSSGGTTTTSGGATAVPEPGVIGLFGIAALAIAMRSRRRKTR